MLLTRSRKTSEKCLFGFIINKAKSLTDVKVTKGKSIKGNYVQNIWRILKSINQILNIFSARKQEGCRELKNKKESRKTDGVNVRVLTVVKWLFIVTEVSSICHALSSKTSKHKVVNSSSFGYPEAQSMFIKATKPFLFGRRLKNTDINTVHR